MYRFTRFAFRINAAPEIFQCMMDQKLAGIEGIIVYIDDVLIYANTLSDLRDRTTSAIDALAASNLTLNMEKCEFEKAETKFLGHNLSGEGFAIDEDKVRDITRFKTPTNATDLRGFLGLASYVSDFIPKFADLV